MASKHSGSQWFASIFLTAALASSPLTLAGPTSAQGQFEAPVRADAPLGYGDWSAMRVTLELRSANDYARASKVVSRWLGELPKADARYPLRLRALVTGMEQERLTRMSIRPAQADELNALLDGHVKDAGDTVKALKPMVTRLNLSAAERISQRLSAADGEARIRGVLVGLSLAEANGLNALTSLDEDGDGLTNTQEAWWCTNPLNADSDGDGASDAVEVQQAKEWVGNLRATFPAKGKPFLNWPMQDNGGNNPNCPDSDRDGVPDLAEQWELGLNPNNESTDGDKFDDGQELFGSTLVYWGLLPRAEDVTFITAEMPSWVIAPGNHPFAAGVPQIVVEAPVNSIVVEAVSTLSGSQTVAAGTQREYGTSKLLGSSTSVANEESWNSWSEVSDTSYTYGRSSRLPTVLAENEDSKNALKKKIDGLQWSVAEISVGTAGVIVGCGMLILAGITFGAGLACIGGVVVVGKGLNGFDQDVDEIKKDLHDLQSSSNSCVGHTALLRANQVGTGDLSCIPGGVGLLPNASGSPSSYVVSRDRLPAPQGTSYGVENGKQLNTRQLTPLSYSFQGPTSSRSDTRGASHGGSLTTSTSEYEEHTITQGEAFLTEESWGTTTAVDSAHAADMWFTYRVRNLGTDYARQICGLTFKITLGDDESVLSSYHAATDIGGNGCILNFVPGESHSYVAARIGLTLEQMKRIDLGDRLRVVVEDYSFGTDEQFLSNAVNGGIVVTIDDGFGDLDDSLDTFLIPTWGDGDTMQDVLGRYFPHSLDSNDQLSAIWTPESRNDTPAWCVEPRRYSPISPQVWCKHALSTADWWNIYLNNLGDGTGNLADTLAAPNSTALFRFNKDTDLDGYSDRTELQMGTLPFDPASHPKPEIIAGANWQTAVNSVVTGTISLLNTGLYDAYGVELVLLAPDDSIAILNNTVGGSGHVRAGRSVVVGSSIKLPGVLPGNWANTGHAKPSVGGYYTGNIDRNYSLTAMCGSPGGCDVGAGTWSLGWSDGTGVTGMLNFGAGYASPNPLYLNNGVQLSLLSGKVNGGETFTLTARPPLDTFSYQINRQPYTDPVVMLSYNDPQGNHRSIVPVTLASPTQDLAPYAGQMIPTPGVEMVTSQVFTTGLNSFNVVVDNPTGKMFSNAHVFVEMINVSGTVVSEVPLTVTLQPGPNVVPVTIDTAVFSPTFDASQDYIVMVFFTDYQGNIAATAGRPASSFQPDPKATASMAAPDETWNFGTAQQNTLMSHEVCLANTGLFDLLTYVGAVPGLTLSQTGSRRIGPADQTCYMITLNTEGLPLGSYDETIPIRTSDPAAPIKNLRVLGSIIPAQGTMGIGALVRPLEVTYTVNSGVAGNWITLTHNLGPDASILHPCKVYVTSTLQGVGAKCTDFAAGTASAELFGTGLDGPSPSSGNLSQDKGAGTGIVNSGSAGSTSINVSEIGNVARINPGDKVIIHQTQGTGAGCWEVNTAVSDFGGGTATYTLQKPLACTYSSGGNNHAQIQRIPQYSTCNVTGSLGPPQAWDGTWGGILAMMCSITLTNFGSMSVSGSGFRLGGLGRQGSTNPSIKQTGEGHLGYATDTDYGGCSNGSTANFGSGGGHGTNCHNDSGGGGGHKTSGFTGQSLFLSGGVGGSAVGTDDLANIQFGGQGGGGSSNYGGVGGRGGAGGGIAYVSARSFTNIGTIAANGISGENGNTTNGTAQAGGGGAGGSVLLIADTASFGVSSISALGGVGGIGVSGANGGAGSVGRIRALNCTSIDGTTNPPASGSKLTCHIAEQSSSSPNQTRLNVPLGGTQTYTMQYGVLVTYSTPSSQVITLRVPAGLYLTATAQALVSGLTANPTATLNVGDDSLVEWSPASVSNASTNELPDLAAAFNAWWATHNSPTTGNMDVPVRISLGSAGQVMLTNLQMQLATTVGGPGGSSGASYTPLDVDVSANAPAGTWIIYTHTLGPNADRLHPVKVYTSGYGVLHGVGKYATDFAAGTASADMFGDGRDGVMPANGYLDFYNGIGLSNGVGAGTVNSGGAGSNVINVSEAYGIWRIDPGDKVIIHQTQGVGAGCWEINTALGDFTATTGTYTLRDPLKCNYSSVGNNRAQIQRIPQFSICSLAGTATPLTAWNGSWGGILAVMCKQLSVSGELNAVGYGFRGGASYNYSVNGGGQFGQTGESNASPQIWPVSSASNSNGGGGGNQNSNGGPGGGGGGNGSPGADGSWAGPGNNPGRGGAAIGGQTQLLLGGGGGGARAYSNPGGAGASGGGIVFLAAENISLSGQIRLNGTTGGSGSRNNPGPENQYGNSGGGGGGSGGTLFIRTKSTSIASGITAVGASGGGSGGGSAGSGGSGGIGRVLVEYCESATIASNPQSTPQKLTCYVLDQLANNQHQGQFNVIISGANTYKIQYGIRSLFSGAGTSTETLRMPAGLFSGANLQVLVSGTAANRNLCVDVGNDGNCEIGKSVPNNSSTDSGNLSAAFNAYWQSHSAPTTGTIDVPIRVTLDGAGQVLLTNVQAQTGSSGRKQVRMTAQQYSALTLNAIVDNVGSSQITFGADVACDGSIEFSWTGFPTAPVAIGITGAAVLSSTNAYLLGKTGEQDVPVCFAVAPNVAITLNSVSAAPVTRPDATLNTAAISAEGGSPLLAPALENVFTEADSVTFTAVISNIGANRLAPVVASFFAVLSGSVTYLGSAFANETAAGASQPVSLTFSTLGMVGNVAIRVVLDPYNRISETLESNNVATATLTLRSRADLRVRSTSLPAADLTVGKPATFAVVIGNDGQTAAPANTLGLFRGNADTGIPPEEMLGLDGVPGAGAVTVTVTYTPTAPGPLRLSLRANLSRTVNEFDLSNNDLWLDRYVGVGGERVLDSGNPSNDPTYTVTLGYGAVDEGQPDTTAQQCPGSAGAPEDTFRRDPGGRVVARFDHLKRGAFYHLDVVLNGCNAGAGRQETIKVNGVAVAGPIDIGGANKQRISRLLDPALYAEREISVTIETTSSLGAVASVIALREVEYRYIDAGGGADLAYMPQTGQGWLDTPTAVNANCGSLPYQTLRVDQNDNELRYRFDGLNPTKKYVLRSTFYQCEGINLQQGIQIDARVTGADVFIPPSTVVVDEREVPLTTYANDGSIDVSILRQTDATGALLSEIALEEKTLEEPQACPTLRHTTADNFSMVYGGVYVGGLEVPAGTLVTAEDPRGNEVGCFAVSTAGIFGTMALLGEDTSVVPALPGMRAGEPPLFRIGGALAVPQPAYSFTADADIHPVTLTTDGIGAQQVLMVPGWNFVSTRNQHPVGLVETVLRPISGKYCRARGETQLYACTLPENFRTLKQLNAGVGYYIYITNTATVNGLFEGVTQPPDKPIPLHAGLNWAGYLPPVSLPVTYALQSLAGHYVRVVDINSDQVTAYMPALPQFSFLNTLRPGSAYLIYTTDAVTLTYPATPPAMAQVESKEAEAWKAQTQASCGTVPKTPDFTLLYGYARVNGRWAAPGAKVEAVTPHGVVVGCAVVREDGMFGLFAAFGSDPMTGTPGALNGQALRFRIDGLLDETMTLTWENDHDAHVVYPSVTVNRAFLPGVSR